jgi:Na+/H+-dicarboxylate symporter
LAAFVIGVFVLSFVTSGVPSGGMTNTIPLLLALGIPLQGIVLLNTVEEIPDFFETLLNVTADMTVATIVARFRGAPMDAADAEPCPSVVLVSAAKFPG